MPRSRRSSNREAVPAPAWRNRHGRSARGSITGPHLPMLYNRIDMFELAVASTADYLKGLWPDELSDVHFDLAAAPVGPVDPDGVERWHVDAPGRRITLYRLPIQRLAKLHRNDEAHRRMYVESCVFRAVAELLGKDPWDLAPDRFRHL